MLKRHNDRDIDILSDNEKARRARRCCLDKSRAGSSLPTKPKKTFDLAIATWRETNLIALAPKRPRCQFRIVSLRYVGLHSCA
jgi:hypothetical protein